jgi:hypothetical protein
MSTNAAAISDEDTQAVPRPAPRIVAERFRAPARRLADMDLDPPEGRVPSEVIAYFEAALDRERARTD